MNIVFLELDGYFLNCNQKTLPFKYFGLLEKASPRLESIRKHMFSLLSIP